MTYSQFLNNIAVIINKMISYLNLIYNSLINNFIFKTLVYLIILSFIIWLLYEIINIILKIFDHKKIKKNKDVE